MTPEANRIYQGDCLGILQEWPDNCVDTVVTDPPYNVGLNYGNGFDDARSKVQYFHWLKEVLSECARISKLRSVAFFWLSRHLVDLARVVPEGMAVKRVCAWYQREMAGDRFTGHGPSYCWGPIIWLEHAETPAPYFGHPGGHVGRDMLMVNHVRHDKVGGEHPCPRVLTAVQPVIQWLTPGGGLVCDPFLGTGTTAVAALRLGSRFVGCEQNGDWIKIAEKRIAAELAQGKLL